MNKFLNLNIIFSRKWMNLFYICERFFNQGTMYLNLVNCFQNGEQNFGRCKYFSQKMFMLWKKNGLCVEKYLNIVKS